MLRWFNLILLAIALLSLVSVYYIKYQTIETANKKIALERKIKEQKNALSLLKADWAYLNQPSYIEPIILRHKEELGLKPIEQSQYIKISDLPARIVSERDKKELDLLFEAIEQGVDPIALLIEANLNE